MSTSPDGYFTAYVNSRAFRPGPPEKLLMQQDTELSRKLLPGSQVYWAGSQRKATAIGLHFRGQWPHQGRRSRS